MKIPRVKKDFMLRVRMDKTVLMHIHQLGEKRNINMSKIIRDLVEKEFDQTVK